MAFRCRITRSESKASKKTSHRICLLCHLKQSLRKKSRAFGHLALNVPEILPDINQSKSCKQITPYFYAPFRVAEAATTSDEVGSMCAIRLNPGSLQLPVSGGVLRRHLSSRSRAAWILHSTSARFELGLLLRPTSLLPRNAHHEQPSCSSRGTRTTTLKKLDCALTSKHTLHRSDRDRHNGW